MVAISKRKDDWSSGTLISSGYIDSLGTFKDSQIVAFFPHRASGLSFMLAVSLFPVVPVGCYR